MTFLQLYSDEDLYLTNDHNAIKITAAILGIVCVLIAIVMSVFMYRHYLRRQQLTISTYRPIHRGSASSDALLITARAQREEQTADIEANIDSPLSPVMQQGLLHKELVKNYGSNSHHPTNAFLKPPPRHS
ncbi:hypothetical protein PS15m_011359 [Mucor circinelloides]